MVERILRNFIPSTALLARTPVGKLLDAIDAVVRASNSKWKALPPASLRLRVGVGNRLLFNHAHFTELGRQVLDELVGKGCLKRDSRILELGCGCGRFAIPLRKFLDFGGDYVGQDVDQQLVHWCQRNLSNPSFRFLQANIFNSVYNPQGKPLTDYKVPADDAGRDLVIAISLFTHLLYNDFVFYVSESARVLRSGGILYMTMFVMDFIKQKLGDRWTFAHEMENCFCESLKYPEAAVAYRLDLIKDVLGRNGFAIREMYELHAYTIIAEKQ